jgi:cysteine desulfurase
MSPDPVYLDYNATTPVDPLVVEAMIPYLRRHFGNPSSPHVWGRRAREAVAEARRQVAGLLGCLAEEILFTSGGTESNNLALFGVARSLSARARHVVTSKVEHPAVVEPCLAMLEEGTDVTFLPVDSAGRVAVESLEKSLRPETFLVTIMHANNEVGTIQPIAEIADVARGRGVFVHTDAAQSVGKIPVDVNALGVDLLTVAGHKLYAPKGVGALYGRRGTPVQRILFGAGQERGLRPGTENVPEIVGLGTAARLAAERVAEESARTARLRDLLEQRLLQSLEGTVIHARSAERLPNTSSIGFRGLTANRILSELEDVAASAGAACHAETVKVSHVLGAMGVDMDVARGTCRFSVGRFTTEDEIERAAASIVKTVRRLRGRPY